MGLEVIPCDHVEFVPEVTPGFRSRIRAQRPAAHTRGEVSHMVMVCESCGEQWRLLPLSFYFNDDASEEIAAIIADSLRDGRNREAISIYLDTHWDAVMKILAELERE